MTAQSYDVFISYRRTGGSAEARLIQSALRARHVRGFLDVTELGRGYFDEALLKHIEQIPNFVVILSPASLDRGEDDEDWLRKEIAHALATERNVVPLLMPGFQFPARLPDDIRNLARHQGMDYSHLYFDAMLQKLIATLDLTNSPDGAGREERPSDGLQQSRDERALLEQERRRLDGVQAAAEKERLEAEARQKTSEQRLAKDAERRADGTHGGGERRQRWSDRLLVGDVRAGAAARQAGLVAFWSALLAALASFAEVVRGENSQAAANGGILVLGLAFWVRAMPAQAATPGMVIMGLAALTQAGTAISGRFDQTAAAYALLAAVSTWAFWLVNRARTGQGDVPTVIPAGSFGARFAALVGAVPLSGAGANVGVLRWIFAARLVAGLLLVYLLGVSQPFMRQNIAFVIWGSAAWPLALYFSFRSLRHPLLSLSATAVLTAVASPSFWSGGSAWLVLLQETIGILVFAWAAGEIASVKLALWFGAVAANLAGVVLLHWLAPPAWILRRTDFVGALMIALVFWCVFVLGIAFQDSRKSDIS